MLYLHSYMGSAIDIPHNELQWQELPPLQIAQFPKDQTYQSSFSLTICSWHITRATLFNLQMYKKYLTTKPLSPK